MKAIILTSLFLFASTATLLAQWNKDSTINTPVCTAVGQQASTVITSDSANGAIVAWADSRSGSSPKIYIQRIAGDGAMLWNANGNRLCTYNAAQYPAGIVSDGASGAIVAWQDYRRSSSEADIVAQRISATGQNLWPDTGKIIISAPGDQSGLRMLSDGKGGAFVFWQDNRSGVSHIYSQRIDNNGNPLWKQGGVMICDTTGSQYFPIITSDSAGGVIVAWEDRRSGNADQYAQRIDSSGNVLWTSSGVAVCAASGDQEFASITSDGKQGAIVMWRDRRTPNEMDVYAQRIRGNGSAAWASNGAPVIVAPNAQYSPLLAADGVGGAFVSWVGEDDVRTPFIYVDRLDSLGAKQWNAAGVKLCSNSVEDLDQLLPDGTGGMIATWSDGRAGSNNFDLYAQRVNRSGAMLWTANGRAISKAAGTQYGSAAINDNAGGAIITWSDLRSDGGDIYAARIGFNGGLLPVQFLSFSAQDGGASVKLRWTTTNEHNNAGFEVQRKAQGHIGIDWVSIGFVQGRNNATGTAEYRFEDVSAPKGSLDYRLRQRDVDGSYTYSQVVNVFRNNKTGFEITSLYPQPLRDELLIGFTLPGASNTSLEIFDMLGRPVRMLLSENLEAGSQSFHLTGLSLSPGRYQLRLTSDGAVRSAGVIIR